jgi:hypothetical protein
MHSASAAAAAAAAAQQQKYKALGMCAALLKQGRALWCMLLCKKLLHALLAPAVDVQL